MTTNLKIETQQAIELAGKDKADIAWIGGDEFEIPQKLFWALSDVEYSDGYGAQEVAKDLVIVFSDGSYLSRGEYDGLEWWEHHETPDRPTERRDGIRNLTTKEAGKTGWETLADLNEEGDGR